MPRHLSGFLAALVLMGASLNLNAQEKLTLTGSSTVAPLVLEIGKRFEKQNPEIRVDVQSGGSSRGISDVRVGLADIGMVSRKLKPDEQDLKAFTVAMDGIGIIVHQTNPLASLSHAQVTHIYTGKIKNWKEIGGKDQPITVVNKAEGRSTLELFLGYFQLQNSDIKAQVVIGENQQGIKTVAGNPGAIGYVSIGTAEFEETNGAPIRLLPMEGIAATVDAVRAGSFPLSRPLNLVIKGTPSALQERFLHFAQSEAVHDLVKEQFFVSLEH